MANIFPPLHFAVTNIIRNFAMQNIYSGTDAASSIAGRFCIHPF
nr:MAG TPA: hypothetical protein [Caudoviricetes sp.]